MNTEIEAYDVMHIANRAFKLFSTQNSTVGRQMEFLVDVWIDEMGFRNSDPYEVAKVAIKNIFNSSNKDIPFSTNQELPDDWEQQIDNLKFKDAIFEEISRELTIKFGNVELLDITDNSIIVEVELAKGYKPSFNIELTKDYIKEIQDFLDKMRSFNIELRIGKP